MINFIDLVESVLQEQQKTKQELFNNKVISQNTFFKYTQRIPSLKTVIKIANYLKVSLNYLFDLCSDNNFKQYNISELNFYKNLTLFIKSKNISYRKFCKDLGYSKDNLNRWKNGVTPSINKLLEIAEYFNCYIDDLIL